MTDWEESTFPLAGMECRAAEDGRHYIEGIAVPWQTRTDRVAVPELFERGAFRSLVESAAKVKLTDYNHSRERVPVGYSWQVEDRTEGLWMRFRLNNTPEGRSALENTQDGVYAGLSVGFIARKTRMVDGVRHVTDARLDHVSLVEEPAYREAVILEARQASVTIAAELEDLRALVAKQETLDTHRYTSQNLLMAKIRQKTI